MYAHAPQIINNHNIFYANSEEKLIQQITQIYKNKKSHFFTRVGIFNVF